MSFTNENVIDGLSKLAPFQVGRSDVDNGASAESNLAVPWASDPVGSFMYFDCTVGCMLDSGIVVHNRLPQVNSLPDTLAAGMLDDPDISLVVGGVNLKCRDQYRDIVQRMGHARYWFRIWGQGIRVGKQVPIPGIKLIGGIPAIPYDANPQWGYNRIAPGANYGGVILWHAVWSLWYTTAVPPTSQYVPAADPTAQVAGAPSLPPTAIQSPYSPADDNAQPSGYSIPPGQIWQGGP